MTEIPPPPPPIAMPVGGSEEKNSLGVWALVLGILSILCCGLFTGIPAIILGNNSKKAAAEGRATNGTLGNVGFILGIVGTVLGTVGWAIALLTGSFASISGT
ncbi:DUF4190 domain-containing protein [Demequina sp.]|uniref:DUF4190 domain-containing protein n=1 Tax=Demequina sp. TaxID=2050685 RepID=UPI0025C61B7C|nr:DUF4190 domain-containing protein [Demequina sp.]